MRTVLIIFLLIATIGVSLSVGFQAAENTAGQAPPSPVPAADPPVLSQHTERCLKLMLDLHVDHLRPKAAQSTEYESLRPLCFSSRSFAYVFHVSQPRTKGAKLEWSEYDLDAIPSSR